MGNILESDFEEFSGSHDPEDIMKNCKEKIERYSADIGKLETQIEEIEKKVEGYLVDNRDPFELMKTKLELIKKLEKYEDYVESMKDMIKNAEDIQNSTDTSQQQKLMEKILKEQKKLGDDGSEDVMGDMMVVSQPVKSESIGSIKRQQDDIEKMFTEDII